MLCRNYFHYWLAKNWALLLVSNLEKGWLAGVFESLLLMMKKNETVSDQRNEQEREKNWVNDVVALTNEHSLPFIHLSIESFMNHTKFNLPCWRLHNAWDERAVCRKPENKFFNHSILRRMFSRWMKCSFIYINTHYSFALNLARFSFR